MLWFGYELEGTPPDFTDCTCQNGECVVSGEQGNTQTISTASSATTAASTETFEDTESSNVTTANDEIGTEAIDIVVDPTMTVETPAGVGGGIEQSASAAEESASAGNHRRVQVGLSLVIGLFMLIAL